MLFIIQSPYWFTIGRQRVFSLGGWTPHVHTEFHEHRATLVHLGFLRVCYRTVTFFGSTFQSTHTPFGHHVGVQTPDRSPVWAVPISLAATLGITLVFSSSAYLDVSVQRVCPPCGVTGLQPAGLPHSDTHGSMLMCSSPWIFAAYHVLHRL